MSWSMVGVLIALAGMAFGVVKFLRRDASTGAALSERDAQLEIERERVRRLEEAEARARAARRRDTDERAAAVRDAAGAAGMLRDVTQADDPEVN